MFCRILYFLVAIGQALSFTQLGMPVMFRVNSVISRCPTIERTMTLTTKEEAISFLQSHHSLLTDWMHAPPSACNISQAVDGIKEVLHFVGRTTHPPCNSAAKQLRTFVLQRESDERREYQASMLDQLCALYQHYVGEDKISDSCGDDWYAFELYVAQQKFNLRMGNIDESTLQERLQKYRSILGIDIAIFEEAHVGQEFGEIQSPADQEIFVQKCEAFPFDERYQALVAYLLADIKAKELNKRIFRSLDEGIICSEIVTK